MQAVADTPSTGFARSILSAAGRLRRLGAGKPGRRPEGGRAGRVIPGVMSLGGVKLAIAAAWIPVSNSVAGQKSAREHAAAQKREGVVTDLFYVRQSVGGSWQVAIGSTVRGQSAGMPIGAALVATAFPNDRVVVWASEREDGPVWICFTDRGSVHFDRHFDDRDRAVEFLSETITTQPPGVRLLATADCGRLVETDIEELDAAIFRQKTRERLGWIDASVRRRRLLLLLLLAGTIGYGLLDYQEQQELAEETARQLRLQAEQPPPPPPPWALQPNALLVARACGEAAAIRYRSIPGWNFSSIACSPTTQTATIRFIRTRIGRIGDLEYVVNSLYGVTPTIDNTASVATISIKLPSPTGGFGRAGAPRSTQVRDALDIAQFAALKGQRDAIHLIQDSNANPLLRVSIQSRLSVDDWSPVLARPAFVLRSIAREESQGAWTIKGDLYAKTN